VAQVPTNIVLLAALVGTVIAIGWLLVRRASYVATYKYTEADVENARKESVKGSRSTVNGKIHEQLVPIFPEFCSQFNPRDARFLGSPIDFVVADGLDEGYVKRIVFVEVKTGKSPLAPRERLVRDAVEARRVEFQILRLPGAVEPDRAA
jgi:predicted Holliday junction resolvase-like endonuclease